MSGDTGTSSKTIAHVMLGVRAPRYGPDVPYDPGDFGRCYRLLKLFPLWELRLPEVAEAYPAWSGLVREWSRLSALYEEELPSGKAPRLYARMQELRKESQA